MGVGLRLLAVAVVAATWGCFSAPSADVLFSCDPQGAPDCPPEYSCQSDGCCHRDGSDVDASRGACNSTATSGFDPSATETNPGSSTAETDPGSSGSSASSGSETDAPDTDTDPTAGTTGETGGSSSSSG